MQVCVLLGVGGCSRRCRYVFCWVSVAKVVGVVVCIVVGVDVL